ncbi:MAG: hypothetical protein F6J96_20140 [Symploca sp. SIO1C2]|nr:hypothetical protein [Symploca sp. SIO1C2]
MNMIGDCAIYRSYSSNKRLIVGDYIPYSYYATKPKPPLAKDEVFIRPSRNFLAIKKLYDVVFKSLFIAIAVVTLLVVTVVDTVFSSKAKKSRQLNRAY